MRLFLRDGATQEANITANNEENEGAGGDIAGTRPSAALTDQETSNNS